MPLSIYDAENRGVRVLKDGEEPMTGEESTVCTTYTCKVRLAYDLVEAVFEFLGNYGMLCPNCDRGNHISYSQLTKEQLKAVVAKCGSIPALFNADLDNWVPAAPGMEIPKH